MAVAQRGPPIRRFPAGCRATCRQSRSARVDIARRGVEGPCLGVTGGGGDPECHRARSAPIQLGELLLAVSNWAHRGVQRLGCRDLNAENAHDEVIARSGALRATSSDSSTSSRADRSSPDASVTSAKRAIESTHPETESTSWCQATASARVTLSGLIVGPPRPRTRRVGNGAPATSQTRSVLS